jgi:hypothetical protein
MLRRAAALSLLLIAGTYNWGAAALLAPEYYRRARAEAPYHLQVAISKVVPPASGPSDCLVEGKVVRVFRDATGKHGLDSSIRFPVPCAGPDDRVPAGGVIWTDTDALLRAKFIEVYLVDADGGLATALSQSRIIEAPSDTPQRPVD